MKKNNNGNVTYTGRTASYDAIAKNGGPIFVTKGQPMSDVRCNALAQRMMREGVSPKRCF